MKTDEQLRKENPELYKVAREGATEAPHKGEYVHTKDDGTYHCAVCDAALFSSETKFDSGSGWPSFTQPVKSAMGYVYVLRMSNNQFYTGSTVDLPNRIKQHQAGKVATTKKYLPVELIHYETFKSETEARQREKQLEHHGSAYQKLKEQIKDNSEVSLAGFTDPMNTEAIELHPDDSLGMRRTEVTCKNCGAHLGHVFPDGPEKDGITCDRYCINSVSLDLKEN